MLFPKLVVGAVFSMVLKPFCKSMTPLVPLLQVNN